MRCVRKKLAFSSVYREHGKSHSLPVNLQAQFDGPKIIDVYSNHLRQRSKQVLHVAGNISYNDMVGQALQLCYLRTTQLFNCFYQKGLSNCSSLQVKSRRC